MIPRALFQDTPFHDPDGRHACSSHLSPKALSLNSSFSASLHEEDEGLDEEKGLLTCVHEASVPTPPIKRRRTLVKTGNGKELDVDAVTTIESQGAQEVCQECPDGRRSLGAWYRPVPHGEGRRERKATDGVDSCALERECEEEMPRLPSLSSWVVNEDVELSEDGAKWRDAVRAKDAPEIDASVCFVRPSIESGSVIYGAGSDGGLLTPSKHMCFSRRVDSRQVPTPNNDARTKNRAVKGIDMTDLALIYDPEFARQRPQRASLSPLDLHLQSGLTGSHGYLERP